MAGGCSMFIRLFFDQAGRPATRGGAELINSESPFPDPGTLTRRNRKYETRKSKYETNPKFHNSIVSNEITVVTELN